MRESGEPMEFGIFDFYKVFSRAFGEGGIGQQGLGMEANYGKCRDLSVIWEFSKLSEKYSYTV